MTTLGADLVVVGAGPAGLGAALAAARDGASVVMLDRADHVGGLCVTRERDGTRYDLGGHIPFVRDDARLDWLRGLLPDDLLWVPRPVASWRGGIRAGRYLDQRPMGPFGSPLQVHPDPPPSHSSAAEVLGGALEPGFVDTEMRPYLEKIDGAPLEDIVGTRPLRLFRDQAAPEGFWFPRLGIGQLMDAMARAGVGAGARLVLNATVRQVTTRGGAVSGVTADTAGGPVHIDTGRLVAACAPAILAPLVTDEPAPAVAMRAVCLVYLRVTGAPLTAQAWVQVDHPAVPAARIMEVGNWSADMTPGDGVVCMECYCAPHADDPVWGLDDAALAAACTRSLVDPLGWLDDPARATPLEVVRLPRAYPLPVMAQQPALERLAAALPAVDGIHPAPGAAVVEAIEAGERAAAHAAAAGDGAVRSPA
ncbi:MAG: NAD(P)-binding protein [Thermoleophilia bacterium]